MVSKVFFYIRGMRLYNLKKFELIRTSAESSLTLEVINGNSPTFRQTHIIYHMHHGRVTWGERTLVIAPSQMVGHI